MPFIKVWKSGFAGSAYASYGFFHHRDLDLGKPFLLGFLVPNAVDVAFPDILFMSVTGTQIPECWQDVDGGYGPGKVLQHGKPEQADGDISKRY